jgi:hypothetical protein
MPGDIRLRGCKHTTRADYRWGLSKAWQFALNYRGRDPGNPVVYTQGGIARALSTIDGSMTHHRMTAAVHWTPKGALSVRLELVPWGEGKTGAD